MIGFFETYRQLDWQAPLAKAESNIDIVVYYYDSWVNTHYEAIVAYFRKPGMRMRVFVANPEDQVILDNIRRPYPENSAAVIIEKVARTGERIALALRAAGGNPDRLKFYYVPHFLNYSAQCIDDRVLILSFFEIFRERSIDSPALLIDMTKSAHLKAYWAKEIEGLERVATSVQVKLGR